MQTKWKIRKKLPSNDLSFDVEKIIKSLLESRSLKTKKEIDDFFSPLHPLKINNKSLGIKKQNLIKAFQRLEKALEDKETVVVYGDYDADGICGTAIVWETLFGLGLKVFPFIPHREKHGYGIKKKGIDEILEDKQIFEFNEKRPSLIITVDNGIVAHKAMEYAKEKQLDVIITDHHQKKKKEGKYILPKANSIIWSDKICGAAVAWFFCREFLKFLKQKNIISKHKKDLVDNQIKTDLIGLATIGTVTDLMPLLGENRALVNHGLKYLKKTKIPGLISLYRQVGLDAKTIETYHLGFIIGPRLNATGRLEHALDSLRLLCSKDMVKTKSLSETLNSINKERQLLTEQTFSDAKKKVNKNKKFIFIGDESYNPGVIGLVAGKLVEKFYRPAIVFSKREKYSKASARSVKGFNIIEAIRSCGNILEDAGGHPLAAGFTIQNRYLKKFEKLIDRLVERKLSRSILTPILEIDCEIKLKNISWELYGKLEKFSPFGFGNPRPIFIIRNLKITKLRTVGNENKHLKIAFDDPQTSRIEKNIGVIDGIGFNLGYKAEKLTVGDLVDVAFCLEENIWNGSRNLQMKIRDIRIAKQKLPVNS